MNEDALLERLPPQNLQAEGALIGSLLRQPDAVADVLQLIKRDHFYSPENQVIYQAIIALYDSHRPVDLVTLPEELAKENIGDQASLLQKLMALMEDVPSAASAMYYAKIVHDKAVARQLITSCNEIIKEAHQPVDDVRVVVERAERRLFDISQDRISHDAAPMSEVIPDTFRIIDELQTGILQGYPTGYADLDERIGGLRPSELIIVAARPSMGKTTFALNVAQHICVNQGKGGVMFSLEMAKEQIALNMLCCAAKVQSHKIRRGHVTHEENVALTRAADIMQRTNFFIDDTAGLSIMEMRAKCRRLKARHNIQFIMVDYIQLMEGSDRRTENRQQEISEISRGLKTIARELDVPVLAISQLSRAPEARDEHKPRMSDLRESGSIEQDADLIMLLLREDYYHEEKRPNETDIIVAKQRNGPTGTVILTFRKEYMRFENYVKESPLE
ncbi:MAG TPA: replicative DNA helicase [Planctomycetota bacterium]|nr:replicative DNA helicase [Planctomycetota bacterium]